MTWWIAYAELYFSDYYFPDFNTDEYLEEHRKFKGIEIEDYPKLYPEEIEKNKREFRKRMYER